MRYSKEQLDFLRKHYVYLGISDLIQEFNSQFNFEKTVTQIKGTLSNHKITCGRSTGELSKGIYAFWPSLVAWCLFFGFHYWAKGPHHSLSGLGLAFFIGFCAWDVYCALRYGYAGG